jgi:hypothetical protein
MKTFAQAMAPALRGGGLGAGHLCLAGVQRDGPAGVDFDRVNPHQADAVADLHCRVRRDRAALAPAQGRPQFIQQVILVTFGDSSVR